MEREKTENNGLHYGLRKNYKFCFGRTSRHQIATNKVITDLLSLGCARWFDLLAFYLLKENPKHSVILPFSDGKLRPRKPKKLDQRYQPVRTQKIRRFTKSQRSAEWNSVFHRKELKALNKKWEKQRPSSYLDWKKLRLPTLSPTLCHNHALTRGYSPLRRSIHQ